MDGALWNLFFALVMAGWAVVIFEAVKADARASRKLCLCHHQRRQHVSALDWDSNYGVPVEHRASAADYRKPDSCRLCLCRHYIEAMVGR